jgi:hypothetical protein
MSSTLVHAIQPWRPPWAELFTHIAAHVKRWGGCQCASTERALIVALEDRTLKDIGAPPELRAWAAARRAAAGLRLTTLGHQN